jgi:hypothetical protein
MKEQGRIQGKPPSPTLTGVGTVSPVPPDPDHLRLELLLDSRDDPIQGRIGHRDGEAIAFVGWLELMAATDRLKRETPDLSTERSNAAAVHDARSIPGAQGGTP